MSANLLWEVIDGSPHIGNPFHDFHALLYALLYRDRGWKTDILTEILGRRTGHHAAS